jgi:glycosyltransferase involved in cell wall biosynthesis
MFIGIDASRATAARRTGTENYSLHLIRELLAEGVDHHFRLYFNRAPEPGLFAGAIDWRVIPFPRLWTHARLSWEMLRDPPDLLFIPSHVLPLVHPARSVVTVHDLGYHYYPQAHTLSQNLYLRWSTRHNARNALRILVDSEATRRDLVAFYQIQEEKVRVVYPGRDETMAPVSDPTLLKSVCGRYGVTGPYLLYVGTLHPRKNLVLLVQAFGDLLRSGDLGSAGHLQLVLGGQKGWLYEEIFAKVRKLDLTDRVVFTGYVADADLPSLLSGAQAFVFPSLYEGFGLPVLEAMACGVPVVCSSASSLPEVTGQAALLVDPLDPKPWTEGLHRVVTDQNLRRVLVERGFEQVRQFSWKRTARETLRAMEEADRAYS